MTYLESYFKTQGTTNSDFFERLITSYIDGNQIISFKEKNSSSNESEMIVKCHEFENKDYSFILTKNNKVIEPKIINNTCIIDNILTPNKDWFILNVTAGNLIELNNSVLSSNKILTDFINYLPKLSRNVNNIEFIDSYFNVGSQNILYTCLKTSKEKVDCYTRLTNGENKAIKRNSIKKFFGKRKTSVSFSTNARLTHERKISIGDLIVELTHDFAEINPRNTNWTIYLKVCKDKKVNFDENKSKYNAT